jgi:hypothetical protein
MQNHLKRPWRAVVDSLVSEALNTLGAVSIIGSPVGGPDSTQAVSGKWSLSNSLKEVRLSVVRAILA